MPRESVYLTRRYGTRRLPRPVFLRTARLNAVGWSALAGAGTVAAGIGALVAPRRGRPLGVAAGPVVVLGVLVALDRRKWRARETGFSFTDDAERIRETAALLAARGLPVTVDPVTADQARHSPSLRYPNRAARRVHAALEELGLPSPRR